MLLILFSFFFQVNKTDLQKNGLQGNVKSAKETTYKAIGKPGGKTTKGQKGTEAGKQDLYLFFDTEKKLTEKIKMNAAGKPVYKYEYKYDPQGKLISETVYNSDNKVFNSGLFKYDSATKEESRYDENKTLFSKFFYHYDTNGNLTEELRHGADGVVKTKNNYTYDANGNKTEDQGFNADGTFVFKNTFTNDSKGLPVEIRAYTDEQTFGKKLCKYDDHQNLVEELEYRTSGDLVQKTTFSYKYDPQGNWTEKIKFVNNVPTFLTERAIEYYP